MNASQQRRRELLVESDINRQVFLLEAEQLRLQLGQLRTGMLGGRWRWMAPLAGLLFAWNLRKFGGLFKGGLGLILLRKAWELFVSRK